MSTPAQFAGKMHRVADGVKRAPREITKRGVLVVKRSVQEKLAADAPRGRLNVGKRGQRVGVRFDLRSDNEAIVKMTGPAHLLERDTKAHRIPRERKTSRAKKRYAVIPGVGVRAYANHPGTKGKHTFERGVEDSKPQVGRTAAGVYFGVVRKAVK